ncbi:MAG: AbrB/MazE/SpoVT family DNA-binding domain-containing protein [Actinomycetota bacterium]|nr:AbrB/MazE/SpoVT family DNA-binding domain-containing protein [Actinomycetota bacterium]
MAHDSAATVRMGPQGRIVIPAEIRRELGLDEGSILGVRVLERALVIETRDVVLDRIRQRFASVPPDRSLAQEVIDERTEEARRETDP